MSSNHSRVSFALQPAQLHWRDDNAPEAIDYGDVYFSREDGRRETEHVFIAGNHLITRWHDWPHARPFVIGETGFGSGLNVLCAAHAFLAHAPATARLHVVSTEQHPFTAEDLARALGHHEDFAGLVAALIDQWPPAMRGLHRLALHERITLDLHFGDAAESLEQLEGRVDAWFLDGFAPSKNPAMWSQPLFAALAGASREGTTFSTFTCAGVVKRGLRQAGFEIKKVPGFGRKREMLSGHMSDLPPEHERHSRRRRQTPWVIDAAPRQTSQNDHIAVIGAGIAGTSVAHALARRGRRVTLIDPTPPGSGASGNRQGALYIRPAVEVNEQSRFYLAALQYAQRFLSQVDPAQALWHPTGVLQLATSDREASRQQRCLNHWQLPESVVRGVDRKEAERLAGQTLAEDVRHGLYYAGAGWVRPDRLCAHLAEKDGITWHQAELEALTSTDTGHDLTLSDGTRLHADHVVLACADGASRLSPSGFLPLQAVRGQVSHYQLDEKTQALSPRCVVCAGGYAPPAWEGVQSLGASFSPNDRDLSLRDEDDAFNLGELTRTLPNLANALQTSRPLPSRSGLRCASPDKSPYAGGLPRSQEWETAYARMGFDATCVPETLGRYHSGLWVTLAHGSRGLVSAPLIAELLASRICEEPLPLPDTLVDHLNPGRRLIRAIIRREAR
ncbi:bifunctional tRNA (5-methylaminomethyl-2-thiouridine)(34)-methyltransferase MnmD/FAD-dependent 5-carboxymethylaminomethyl-2-thiouridine(34) oxidoreductase MnmC [Kushneria konosiri]|uniref:tRNA 5-methylaminomethyl-2-thiouridine biosynthesis bifunctional protein MnmC n=1 Tax=Kushneria konosiri TaxID=698828 RepID=A0A2Z2H7M0_9GAMM|nr:bifunctional tRNA (5-methylaminomethyl-2-thiouridine)(34)-methyltransferase MnmD/FAD-dependent 5-carboxymethylaminomethyl-2-thiouridine(34) oxidoreductase MnmC [Kushneria konosiri]ARS53324.1 bifunctional tRNA (5-methylaminomethyl-2-thiouridine)(34)-methyltransferase MnmD/FAD-dependent 5-carboxymethylaminomethyl-2-thiouridine(34) oxidoreductase MnmC [Kushneria konosiri]